MYNTERAAQLEQVARLKVHMRSTKDLIRDFIITGAINDPHIPTVRGWIMDELEARNPEAFSAWIDGDCSDNALPKYFINCQ